MSFVDWPDTLDRITTGSDLSRDEARDVLGAILVGDVSPAHIAAFLVGMKMKGETVEEISGLVDAMLEVADEVPLVDRDAAIDTCGTGGDRSSSINVSTAAAFVVAGAGGQVCKHGNRAVSSSVGSGDVLETLGVSINGGPDEVAASIEQHGFGFCFAPRFHSAARFVAPVRRELAIPTIFNVLGPLSNPARLRRQVIGVGDPAMAEKVVEVLAARGAIRAMVVYGDDGLDELTTTTTSTVYECRDGTVNRYTLDAAELGLERASKDDLRGGDAEVNAEAIRRVLEGDPGPHRDIVVLNAAAGLIVAGLFADWPDAIAGAQASIDSGKAKAVLAAVANH